MHTTGLLGTAGPGHNKRRISCEFNSRQSCLCVSWYKLSTDSPLRGEGPRGGRRGKGLAHPSWCASRRRHYTKLKPKHLKLFMFVFSWPSLHPCGCRKRTLQKRRGGLANNESLPPRSVVRVTKGQSGGVSRPWVSGLSYWTGQLICLQQFG